MKKTLGIGSLALFLVILAFLWSFTINGYCLGDRILNLLSLPAWSNGTSGTHYTVFYSFIFLIPATVLGRFYTQHLFATTAKTISYIFIASLLISPIFMIF